MKITSATFESSAPNLRSAPKLPLPEFALIGRSNVGKSSLINLLTEKRDLARVSDLPGKTRLINFFLLNNAWRLVDLPGYGYAHVSRTERADFNRATADFLEQREMLQHTFLLIDSRHPPQGIDQEFLRWIAGTGVPFSIVLTKVDKQSAQQTQQSLERFRQSALADLPVEPAIFLTSSKTKAGRKELLAFITTMLD